MSLKGSGWVDMGAMVIDMNETRLCALEQLRAFLEGWFDSNEGYVLHVRKAVCELIEAKSEAATNAATNAISLTHAAVDQLIAADTPTGDPPFMAKLAQLMASGAIPVTKGTAAGVVDFFKHFQPAPKVIPPPAGR